MTLILKCGGVVYRVNVADTTSFCATLYICGVLWARPCNYMAVCSECGESVEAGAIWSLATGVPNVVHRFHKSESE